MSDPSQAEAACVKACLALAREVYEGPVRINFGRAGDLWTVGIVREAEVQPRRGSWPTVENELLVERAADRLEALKQLETKLSSLRQAP
jgi:hypothetical protein